MKNTNIKPKWNYETFKEQLIVPKTWLGDPLSCPEATLVKCVEELDNKAAKPTQNSLLQKFKKWKEGAEKELEHYQKELPKANKENEKYYWRDIGFWEGNILALGDIIYALEKRYAELWEKQKNTEGYKEYHRIKAREWDRKHHNYKTKRV